jgi:mannose-6-phosphate isomerase-like protein (cupin superfamily)
MTDHATRIRLTVRRQGAAVDTDERSDIAMAGFVGNIESLTRANDFFRRVVFTAPHSQLVVMCLGPGQEIGLELHDHIDQFFRVERGEGVVILNGLRHTVSDGDAVVVPAGTEHNVINTSSDGPLLLYTIYSPPAHRDGVIHATKAEAEADEADHPKPVAGLSGRPS